MANGIKKFILDILFPISCVFCRKPGIWICKKCFGKIKINSRQVCPCCEKVESPQGRVCPACREKLFEKNKTFHLDNLICATPYEKLGAPKLVYLFKYNFIKDLGIPLGKIMARSIIENNLPLPDLITAVPLHKRRLRWRGFNQAEVLAGYTGKNLAPGYEIPVFSDLIIRKKYASAQMKIKNYQERQRNVSHVFSINPSFASSLKNKNILLVDDICTTGSTLMECAKILKQNGAQKVFGAVVARQEYKK